MPQILVVEDDLDIAEQVLLFFNASGFTTHHITDGSAVMSWVKENNPDAIILDVMLPNLDGVECMKQIRAFSMVPIIMVTAKVEEADRLKGLEHGADDYVCKPFSGAELVMRVKAILRRCASAPSTDVVVQATDAICLIEDALEVEIKGVSLGLTKV